MIWPIDPPDPNATEEEPDEEDPGDPEGPGEVPTALHACLYCGRHPRCLACGLGEPWSVSQVRAPTVGEMVVDHGMRPLVDGAGRIYWVPI